jgi:protein O-mannosyl-transferase
VSFRLAKKHFFVFIALLVVAIIFYYPIINNRFLSDDYDSLYRICVERRILFKELLRPLIDISFYLNYMISGLHPWSYYIINVAIHLINSFLLYRFALSFTLFHDSRREVFAIISAFLFLIYPFHNEAVVWLTGRVSSTASLCAIIVLNLWVSSLKQSLKLLLCGLVYFIGLFSYESILLLPIIVWVLNIKSHFFSKQNFQSFLYAGSFIVGAILIRFIISGAVYAHYGERMVTSSFNVYLSRALKTFGRSIMPPSENAALLQIGFCVFIFFIFWLHFRIAKKIRQLKEVWFNYQKLVVCFLLALILPMLFGISSRTSEGDRLLYFPSYFLCLLLSFWGLITIRQKLGRWAYFLLLFSYFICFLVMNNNQWEKASKAASTIFAAINESNDKNIYLINVPDELEGAYVFRNGFQKSLVLLKYDTTKIFAINYLTRLEYLNFDSAISVKKFQNYIMVPPVTRIETKGGVYRLENYVNKQSFLLTESANSVYYWNRRQLIRLL